MARKLEFLTPNAVGLDGIFNTCRLGIKWHEAVSPGTQLDLVAVDEDGNKQRFGTAIVIGKVFGAFNTLAPLHAAYSHTSAKAEQSDEVEMQFVERLEVGMRTAYGTRFSRDEGVTFLYMIRTDMNQGGRTEPPQVTGNDPSAGES